MHPIILPKISRVFTLPPDTTYFYILVSAASPFLAKMRAERFMRRKTYGVRHIYATTAKRINLRSWEVEVVVIKSSYSKPWVTGRRYKYGCPYCRASYRGLFFLSQHIQLVHSKEWEKWYRKRDEYLERHPELKYPFHMWTLLRKMKMASDVEMNI